MKNKKVRLRCWNCKYVGDYFTTTSKMNNHHCKHPRFESLFLEGKLSVWDTLYEFWHTCEYHKLKNKYLKINTIKNLTK